MLEFDLGRGRTCACSRRGRLNGVDGSESSLDRRS